MALSVSWLGVRNLAARAGEQMGEEAVEGTCLSIHYVTLRWSLLSVWCPVFTAWCVSSETVSFSLLEENYLRCLLE